jgi:hypothetical protein
MKLPFDTSQFFAVFASYNTAIWPAQIVLTALGIAAVALALRPRPWSDRAVAGVLAVLWVWMGLVYHVAFFSTINPAANVFGALFVLEGIALAALGVGRRLRFRFDTDVRGVAGAAFIVYALVLYPVLGYVAGHRYPATPTFGAPCPTTILTLGLLLWAEAPKLLLIVPLAWSLLGASAAAQLGVWEDLGLVAAGLLAAVLTLAPRSSATKNTSLTTSDLTS